MQVTITLIPSNRFSSVVTHLHPLVWFGVFQNQGELWLVHQYLHFGAGRVVTCTNAYGDHPHGEILPWKRKERGKTSTYTTPRNSA